MNLADNGFQIEAKPIKEGTNTYAATNDGCKYAIKQF